jgi:hypothetical protein
VGLVAAADHLAQSTPDGHRRTRVSTPDEDEAVTAIDPATCWVPVPVRWRYVQPGDVIAGKGGLFMVDQSEALLGSGEWVLGTVNAPSQAGDPDEMVSVLVPVPERDARSLVLEDLATHVIGRRTVGAA